MRILITNSVPANGGDEALLRAAIEGMCTRWPNVDITVLCNDPDLACRLLPDLRFGPDLEFVRTSADRERVSELYRSADAVVSAPGGFLHDFYPISDRLNGLEVALALGKPVVLLAQSLGPFWRPETIRRIPEVLNRVWSICVRDAASKKHLINCGVHDSRILETADMAFLWRRIAPDLFVLRRGDVRFVALSFRTWPLGDSTSVAMTLAKAERLCRHLLSDSQRRLTFLSTCQGVNGYVDDSALAVEVAKRLPPELQARCIIDSAHRGPRQLIEAYSRCDAFIGMRLHGCILSMLGGTPAMGLGYESKTEEIFQQLGLADYQVPFDADGDAWLRCADRFLADIERTRSELPGALDMLAARTEANLDCLQAAIESKEGRMRNQPQSDWTSTVPKYGIPHLRLRQVAELTRQLKPRQIVDLGCATGYLRNLCPEVRYVGCDFVAPARPPDFPFYQCDFNRQALPADLQDLELVVCCGLLEYIDDLGGFLAQIRSRLASCGHLVATYFNMNHVSRIWTLIRGRSFPVRPDWRGFHSPQDVADLITQSGFRIRRTVAMNHSFRTAAPVDQTMDAALKLPRPRFWSRLLSHQFLFVAEVEPWETDVVSHVSAWVPPGYSFILVDDDHWSGIAFPDRRVIPFVEKDGHYWGPPQDDETGIRELERLRQDGATAIVFAQPAVWWLDHYAGLHRHLQLNYALLGKNERIVAFDLRTCNSHARQPR